MKKVLSFLILLIVLGGIGAAGYMYFSDMDGPVISLEHDTGTITPSKDIVIHLADAKSGVRSVTVSVRKGQQAMVVVDRSFPSTPDEATVTFSLLESGIKEGQIEVEIRAVDGALAGFGRGNATLRTIPLLVDPVPPRVTVLSPPGASGRKGSACAVAYTLSKEVTETGVQVGDEYFPAYRQESGAYFCLFAFPITMTTSEFTPEIVATDLAGNEGRSRLLLPAQDRRFREDTLSVDDGFLDSKMPAFTASVPEARDNLDRYIKVNNLVRLSNEKTLREVAKNTAPVLLSSGAFDQLPRSASRAGFGDYRTYMYKGEVIDHQTHMGQDFASVKNAPVPAANAGKVVFADDLGIFGNLVIIDHGLGLMSLYSHMSTITVSVGQDLNRGDIIGNTGVTGLAGGDHLHFGMLVNGIQVQPLDWLDANWIRNNITNRLVSTLQ